MSSSINQKEREEKQQEEKSKIPRLREEISKTNFSSDGPEKIIKKERTSSKIPKSSSISTKKIQERENDKEKAIENILPSSAPSTTTTSSISPSSPPHSAPQKNKISTISPRKSPRINSNLIENDIKKSSTAPTNEEIQYGLDQIAMLDKELEQITKRSSEVEQNLEEIILRNLHEPVPLNAPHVIFQHQAKNQSLYKKESAGLNIKPSSSSSVGWQAPPSVNSETDTPRSNIFITKVKSKETKQNDEVKEGEREVVAERDEEKERDEIIQEYANDLTKEDLTKTITEQETKLIYDILDWTDEEFYRNLSYYSEEDKEKLREIDEKLSQFKDSERLNEPINYNKLFNLRESNNDNDNLHRKDYLREQKKERLIKEYSDKINKNLDLVKKQIDENDFSYLIRPNPNQLILNNIENDDENSIQNSQIYQNLPPPPPDYKSKYTKDLINLPKLEDLKLDAPITWYDIDLLVESLKARGEDGSMYRNLREKNKNDRESIEEEKKEEEEIKDAKDDEEHRVKEEEKKAERIKELLSSISDEVNQFSEYLTKKRESEMTVLKLAEENARERDKLIKQFEDIDGVYEENNEEYNEERIEEIEKKGEPNWDEFEENINNNIKNSKKMINKNKKKNIIKKLNDNSLTNLQNFDPSAKQSVIYNEENPDGVIVDNIFTSEDLSNMISIFSSTSSRPNSSISNQNQDRPFMNDQLTEWSEQPQNRPDTSSSTRPNSSSNSSRPSSVSSLPPIKPTSAASSSISTPIIDDESSLGIPLAIVSRRMQHKLQKEMEKNKKNNNKLCI